jgi:hypothetical protein
MSYSYEFTTDDFKNFKVNEFLPYNILQFIDDTVILYGTSK